jgi:membrane fusion protein, multidrug efflux system
VITTTHGGSVSQQSPASTNHARLWLILLIIVIALGIWYLHASKGNEARNAASPNAGAKSAQRQGRQDSSIPVVVATTQKGDFPVYFNGLGTVTAFNTVTVRSRVDGQIVRINFQEGHFVHQGDALVEIDPRPYEVQLEQAEGQLAKDQAQLHNVNVDFQRYQLLFREGVIPKQQLDAQRAQVGLFEGAIKADQAQIDSAKLQIVYSHITAPISGRVGLRLVDIGNIVHAADSNGLLVITQLQPISVIFNLPQDQLQQVIAELNRKVPLPVDAYDRDNITKIDSGKLLTVDNQIDTTTGTFRLKAIFNNERNALFPNQFVNAHLLVDTKRDITIVPSRAIQRGPQGTFVYLAQNDNTVKIQPVTISLTSGSNVGISVGLDPGVSVVVNGQDRLRDGTKIEARAPNGDAPTPANGPSPQSRERLPINPWTDLSRFCATLLSCRKFTTRLTPVSGNAMFLTAARCALNGVVQFAQPFVL